MAIGEHEYALHDDALAKLTARWLGTLDLHSHLRLRPLVRTFPTLPFDSPTPRVLEVGCSTGTNLFEIAKQSTIDGEGYDMDSDAIAFANTVKERLGIQNLRFFCADASVRGAGDRLFDCIMMIDVVEHLDNPGEVIERLDSCLRPGGFAIFSVPTPRYPAVMGRRFHEEVGHVVDGYDLEGLRRLIPASYRMVSHTYSTGALTWPACFFFYRYVRFFSTRAMRTLARLAFYPVRFIDLLNGPGLSVSLFAAYQKPPFDAAER